MPLLSKATICCRKMYLVFPLEFTWVEMTIDPVGRRGLGAVQLLKGIDAFLAKTEREKD